MLLIEPLTLTTRDMTVHSSQQKLSTESAAQNTIKKYDISYIFKVVKISGIKY